ncbi:MAG: hypothetical protein R3B96_14750 [Pirellulaceae bacterium]
MVGVDADEDRVGRIDRPIDLGGETQVSSSSFLDDLIETRLIDRQAIGIPGLDAMFVDVDDMNIDVRTLLGDHRFGRTTNVAGSNTADIFDHRSALGTA